MAFKYIENKDIQRNFVNGISEVEVLPGNFKGHHHYKLNLQAGATYQPAEKYSDKTVIYIFGMGKGYVCTPKNSYNINELAFFVADLDGFRLCHHGGGFRLRLPADVPRCHELPLRRGVFGP